ncbi:MAG: type IV pilus assembly protein PilM, partial [Bacillota bacterium]|nr:type IV pilus assembly protein PilM [Bacillota bacterium]
EEEQWRVEFTGAVPTPEGAVHHGLVKEPAKVAQALRRELKGKKGACRQQAAVAVAGASLVVRLLTLPALAAEELAEAVRWEAEQYLPFALSEACYDFCPLETRPEGGGLEVLLAAARREVVEQILQAVLLADLTPVALEPAPLALGRALFTWRGEGAGEGEGQTVGVVDIGGTSTNLAVFMGRQLRFHRALPWGTDRFEAALNALQKFTLSPDGSGSRSLAEAVAELGEPLAQEIHRSLDYYRSQNNWVKIDRLVLAGGGALLPGLDSYLGAYLSLPVEVFDLFARGERSYPGVTGGVGVGLALWEAAV